MRLALLVSDDIESVLALNLILPRLAEHRTTIFFSGPLQERHASRSAMLGQLRFVERDLWHRCVFPLGEAASPSASRRLFSPRELQRRFGVNMWPLESARTPEAIRALAAADADLFVSVRFAHILGAAAINMPRLGVLNLHSGVLPLYRGVLATFRALLHGDRYFGSTVHWIDTPSIDTGPIVNIQTADVVPSRSLLWHVLSLYVYFAEDLRTVGAGGELKLSSRITRRQA